MAVVQCPKCPLRFDLKPMLADHLRNDHGMQDPAATASLLPPAARVGLVRAPAPPQPAGPPRDEPSGDRPAHPDGV